eukprot:2587209-Pleurochrysis_carterae.AAC.1
MATTTALRRILAADRVVAKSVTPQVVEGLDGQRKRRDAAVLVRGVGDYRQELEAAFVLVELAG